MTLGILVGMRGGVTTDLLEVWTDPDTAMEAVGNSLGVFERVPSAARALQSDTPLRHALYGMLLGLVEGGALEKRPCADGRYAFRWRVDVATTSVAPTAAPVTADGAPALEPAVAVPERPRFLSQLALHTAPLLLPGLSCVLALLAFLWLDRFVALAITGAMTLAGVIGLVRRVQLAAFWTVGLVVAGLLLRFS